MKNVLMYDKYSVGKHDTELNKSLWNCEYYTSQHVNPNSRYGFNEINQSPIRSIPFNYKGIEFNMITCPAGGKLNISDWGLQEIKEPFMLGENEVTQELFEAVMGFNYSLYNDGPKNPVETVTWFDCLEFCNRLSDYFGLQNYYMLNRRSFSSQKIYQKSIETAKPRFNEEAKGFRLPKEWEWQWASMAGTNNKFSGINEYEGLGRVAWFKENSEEEPHPVAQKIPNEWGFYDMSGNVWEWCENLKHPNHPNGPRIRLGGSFFKDHSSLLTSERETFGPKQRGEDLGFRIAKSI
jgi:formylglycine-generating enzyme required for sulfatase activity